MDNNPETRPTNQQPQQNSPETKGQGSSTPKKGLQAVYIPELPPGLTEHDLKEKPNMLKTPEEEGFHIYINPYTGEEVARIPKMSGGDVLAPPPTGERGSSPENPVYVKAEITGFSEEAMSQFREIVQAGGSDVRALTELVRQQAEQGTSYNALSEEEAGRRGRDLSTTTRMEDAYYGFNISYAVQRWLREDIAENFQNSRVRNNIESLIASAEAYPDKEINQSLMQEMLAACTFVLKDHEQLREELRGKIEARYKIHNLNLITKYVDGEKRGPALTAMYANEPYDLIGTDGVYRALKLLEENEGDYFTEGGRGRESLAARQLRLVKEAKKMDSRKVKVNIDSDAKKDLEYNKGGLGYEFAGEEDGALAYATVDGERKSLGFTLGQVKQALEMMDDARANDRIGVGPQTVSRMFFPQDAGEEARRALEQLLSKVRVAFDIAEKFAVGTGYAADHTRIVLKAKGKGHRDDGLGEDDDRRVFKRYLTSVPLQVPEGWSGEVKDNEGNTITTATAGKGEIIDIKAIQKYGTLEGIRNSNLSEQEKTRILRQMALLNAVSRNSNLVPAAFTAAKQKVMEEHWDEIDFNGSGTDDRSGREIGVEFWHNIRQEKEGTRNVALKGVRRFNDSAAVNLVDAAGFASMTDLLLGWNYVYNSAIRPMEKRAKINRKLHNMLVEDAPWLFMKIKSLFGDPVAALKEIREKTVEADLHELETDRLMGTYADGVVYANKEMFDQTGGLYKRKNTLDFAYLFANMVKEGVVTPKKASELYNKHLGRFRGIFVALFQSFGFAEALWEAIKQFFGATVSTK